MLMKILVLNESGRANHEYYHYTDVNGLIGILQSDKMIGSLESEGILKGKFTVSFSRLGKGIQVDSKMVTSPAIVKIVVDGERLADRYKIIPYDWYGGTTRKSGKSENEEAVVLTSKSNKKILLSITDNKNKLFCKVIFMKNSEDSFELKEIITEIGKAKRLNKNIWIFPDESKYRVQYKIKKSILNVVLIEEESSSKDKKILRGYADIDSLIKNPAISNIRKYIKEVQFSDKLKDNDNWIYFAWSPIEYLERELIQKSSKGFNGENSGFKVSHNIKTYQELKNFLDSKGISFSYYKSPKRGFKKVKKD